MTGLEGGRWPACGPSEPLFYLGQLWARIGTRNPMVRIKQGTIAYGQDSNLSVIPLGTGGMDASLPP